MVSQMSLVVVKRTLLTLRHVLSVPSSNVPRTCIDGSQKQLASSLAPRLLDSYRYRSLLNGARANLPQRRASNRILSISSLNPIQWISKRLVATNIEMFRPGEEVTLPSKHSEYHCGHCNYTSRMPIFICNACHSLDPKGGEMDSITHVHAHRIPNSAKSAGATLEEHQANPNLPIKKCLKHDALPCPVCEPFVNGMDLVKRNGLDKPRTCDYFDFFSCPHKFNMDDTQLKQLTNRYRELQRVLHPDVYSAKDGTTAADIHAVQQQSAALADAYRTLRNPYQRAIYLLGLHGIDVNKLNEIQYESMLGASSVSDTSFHNRPSLAQLKAQEQAMLMHVMEVRETLDESEEVAEIKDIIIAASSQIEQCLRAMEVAFEKRDLFDARHRTILLNYLSKIHQEAEGKLEFINAKSKKDPL